MRSVLNSFRVVEALAELQPVGVSDLARHVDLPKTTVQRCLETLEHAGWASQAARPAVRWSLSARVWAVARSVPEHLGLREAAAPVLPRLRDTTNEAVHLTALEGFDPILLVRLDSRSVVRTYAVPGTITPLHATAAGKAILAWMNPADIGHVLAGPLERFTEHTLCASGALQKDLARTRSRGYSLNLWEWREDIVGIGAPLLDEGRPVGAISMSMPAYRFSRDKGDHYGALVADAAHQVMQNLSGL
jgi:IclR family acetate operon transcriptional repressor